MIPISFDVYARPGYSGMSSGAASEGAAKLAAHDYAQLLLDNDPNRQRCDVEIYAPCFACRGAGKYPIGKKATSYIFQKFKDCFVCKGKALMWSITYSILRD